VLICKDHAMVPFYPCRGANGCTALGGKLSCDTSLAKLGDACDKKLEARHLPVRPTRELAVCKGGVFMLDEACKAGQKCLVEGTSTHCAKPDKKYQSAPSRASIQRDHHFAELLAAGHALERRARFGHRKDAIVSGRRVCCSTKASRPRNVSRLPTKTPCTRTSA